MNDTTKTADAKTRPEIERPRVIEGGQGLVVNRIGKSFRKRPVVRGVSLSVRRGEVVGVDLAVEDPAPPRGAALDHEHEPHQLVGEPYDR